MKILSREQIEKTLSIPKVLKAIEQGFILYSQGEAVIPPEGYLTDIRTAAAGYVAAKYLAPKNVACVGIVGTGAQAYYQLKFLSSATQ